MKNEKFEELFKNVMLKVEDRPYDEHNKKDGNWKFIHQVFVANTMANVRTLIEEIEAHYQNIIEDKNKEIKSLNE